MSSHVIKKLRDKWIKFVQVKRANFPGPTASSVICQLHFKEADFKNWGQYKNGFASKLLLNTESAVPTIQSFPSPEQLAEERARHIRMKRPSASGTTSTSSSSQSYSVAAMQQPKKSRKSTAVNKLTVARVGTFINPTYHFQKQTEHLS